MDKGVGDIRLGLGVLVYMFYLAHVYGSQERAERQLAASVVELSRNQLWLKKKLGKVTGSYCSYCFLVYSSLLNLS